MSQALIILADGFEEIEAVSIIDILRRGKVDVTIATLSGNQATGAHNIITQGDIPLDTVDRLYDVIILPGGEPGTTNLENSPLVSQLIKQHYEAGKWVAAICAAPRILDGLGLLNGKTATSYPSTKESMTHICNGG